MTTIYPGALDSFTDQIDNVDDVMAADVNNLQDAILALQTELGTDPAGSATDLKTRLAKSISDAGLLSFAASTLLTISGGSITPTQNWHRIDTESGASSDELSSIATGVDGQLLILRPYNSSHDVTIIPSGNIVLGGGDASLTLERNTDLAILIYDEILGKWICEKFISQTSENSWMGNNVFFAAFGTKYNSTSSSMTLDATHQMMAVNAIGGAVIITLPAAIGCIGRRYDVKKIDDSANTVTIDGNGAELIDGAATKILSAQYATVTLFSSGTGWYLL